MFETCRPPFVPLVFNPSHAILLPAEAKRIYAAAMALIDRSKFGLPAKGSDLYAEVSAVEQHGFPNHRLPRHVNAVELRVHFSVMAADDINFSHILTPAIFALDRIISKQDTGVLALIAAGAAMMAGDVERPHFTPESTGVIVGAGMAAMTIPFAVWRDLQCLRLQGESHYVPHLSELAVHLLESIPDIGYTVPPPGGTAIEAKTDGSPYRMEIEHSKDGQNVTLTARSIGGVLDEKIATERLEAHLLGLLCFTRQLNLLKADTFKPTPVQTPDEEKGFRQLEDGRLVWKQRGIRLTLESADLSNRKLQIAQGPGGQFVSLFLKDGESYAIPPMPINKAALNATPMAVNALQTFALRRDRRTGETKLISDLQLPEQTSIENAFGEGINPAIAASDIAARLGIVHGEDSVSMTPMEIRRDEGYWWLTDQSFIINVGKVVYTLLTFDLTIDTDRNYFTAVIRNDNGEFQIFDKSGQLVLQYSRAIRKDTTPKDASFSIEKIKMQRDALETLWPAISRLSVRQYGHFPLSSLFSIIPLALKYGQHRRFLPQGI